MASSLCGKCGNHTFELKLNEPRNSRVKVNLLQCSSCGTVAGLTDFFDTHAQFETIATQIQALQNHVDSRFQRIDAALAALLAKR